MLNPCDYFQIAITISSSVTTGCVSLMSMSVIAMMTVPVERMKQTADASKGDSDKLYIVKIQLYAI